MSKLDNRNRLIIPKTLFEMTDKDFSDDVRIFFRGKELLFDNHSAQKCNRNWLSTVTINGNNRFHLPKLARALLNLHPGDNVNFYVYNEKITFKKVSFLPENR